MRMAIGLVVFWLTILSLCLFLINRTKMDKKLVFPFSFTIIGLFEFILGILNQMKIGSLVLVVVAMGYLLYSIIKKELTIKKGLDFIKNPVNLLLILCFIYITVLGYNLHITHYDNFSHWGLIVKTMFKKNMLPNFEHAYIDFKGYQPGSACFIYFVGLLIGKAESSMIIAHNYLIFAYFSVLFSFIGKKKKIVKSFLLVCLYVFIMANSLVAFNNLLVDVLVAVCFLYLVCVGYQYQDNLKKLLKFSIPVVAFLFLIKNIGLILDGFFCLYILYLGIKNKKFKLSINTVITIGLVLLATLFIWQGHVSLAYGSAALESKHSLSPQNIIASVKELGMDNFKLFLKIYGTNLLKIKDNIANIFIIALNVSAIPLLFFKKERKGLLKFVLVLDGLYLLYWFILGALYILSMPWGEAKVLASYDRYMMTIIVIIYSLFVLYLINALSNKKWISLYLIIIAIIMVIPFQPNTKNAIKVLAGNDNYQGSRVQKFDQLLDYIPKNKNIYYLYSPSSSNDAGFLRHLGIYKLMKKGVYSIFTLEDVKLSPNSYLVLYEDVSNKKLLKRYDKVNDYVYYVKAKEEK